MTEQHGTGCIPRRVDRLPGAGTLVAGLLVLAAALGNSQESTSAEERLAALSQWTGPAEAAGAAEKLETLLAENPGWDGVFDALITRSAALTDSGDMARANDLLERLSRRDPDPARSGRLAFERGRALEALGQFPAAVLEYRAAWERFPDQPAAARAALAEGRLAETVLRNSQRAREAYEAFVEKHPDHRRSAGVMNRLAMLLDRLNLHAEARDAYRRYSERFPADPGDPALGGAYMGAASACFRAAQLSANPLKEHGVALALYTRYTTLPLAANKGRAWFYAAQAAAEMEKNEDADELFRRAIKDVEDEGFRQAYADWLLRTDSRGKAVDVYLKLASETRDDKRRQHCLARVDDEDFDAWLAANPPDTRLFTAYLERFREGREARRRGRAVLEAWMARADVHNKTVAAGQWREWTGSVRDAGRELNAAMEEGLLAEGFAAALWQADRLTSVAEALAGEPVWVIGAAGQPAGELQVGRSGETLAVRARVFDPRCREGESDWPDDVSFDVYASVPGSETVRQVMFVPFGSSGQGEVRVYENGELQDLGLSEWAFVPLRDGGFELLAGIPLPLLKLDPKTTGFLFEAAVMRGERFETLFPTGMGSAFRNNGQFGKFAGQGLEKDAQAAFRDVRGDRFTSGAEWVLLEEALRFWSGYPDVPADEIAAILARRAKMESPAMPAPEGEAVETAGPVPSPYGISVRLEAGRLIREHGLARWAAAAGIMAELHGEAGAESASRDLAEALKRFLENNDPRAAEEYLRRMLEKLPVGNPLLLDGLGLAAERGSGGWETFWKETVQPRMAREIDRLATMPPDEARHFTRLTLLRALDPARSVQEHDVFLAEYPDSALAPEVRRRRLLELDRAQRNPAEEIKKLVKELADRPAGLLELPVALIPSGPEGADLYEKAALMPEVIAQRDTGPVILRNLVRLQARFGRKGDVVKTALRLLAAHSDAPETRTAMNLAVDSLSEGYLPGGVDQVDVETVFAWLMKEALAGGGVGMDRLSGEIWRLAGHPAGRRPDFESYGRFYQYLSIALRTRNQAIPDLMGPVYASLPGNGAGPIDLLEYKEAPFGAGAQFSSVLWGLFYAPADGYYTFWGSADNWVALEIDGIPVNNNHSSWGRGGLYLDRGTHMARALFVSTGGNVRMRLDWQGPGINRAPIGSQNLSPDLNPDILEAALTHQGAWGIEPWNAYVKRYPRDARGEWMRAEMLAMMDPAASLAESTATAERFPADPRPARLRADSLWRLRRRDEAMDAYAGLARDYAPDEWIMGTTAWARERFARVDSPPDISRLYEDRIRGTSLWPRNLKEAVDREGPTGGLRAHLGAGGRLRTLRMKRGVYEDIRNRMRASVEREKANIESAGKLLAATDTEEKVKADARGAMAHSQRVVETLERAAGKLDEAVRDCSDRSEKLSAHLALRPEENAWNAALHYARAHLDENTLEEEPLFSLAERMWADQREATRPLLEYLIRKGHSPHYVRLAQDRFRQLEAADGSVERHAAWMLERGLSRPENNDDADMLRRACDAALAEGDAYVFSRAAHVLARLYPQNKKYAAYLERLGEVLENAGKLESAEAEYRRVARSSKDEAAVRGARLALARLHRGQGRTRDALLELAGMNRLSLPEEIRAKAGRAFRPAPESVPDDAEVLLLAAETYLDLERFVPAADAVDRAITNAAFGVEFKPSPQTLLGLGEAFLDAARSPAGRASPDRHAPPPPALVAVADRVLKLSDAVFRLHPETLSSSERVEATLIRADAAILMRNFPQAIEEVREAGRHAGDDKALVLLCDLKTGELHFASGDLEAALPVFKRLARLNRKGVSPQALFMLGVAELMRSERELAIEAFRRLWERFPESELVRRGIYRIASTYAEQGAFLEAIRLYEAIGAVRSRPREMVVPGELLTVKVWDADHFIGTGETSIPVKIVAGSGDREEMAVPINRVNRSLFLGTLRVELGTPAPQDGILQVLGGDRVYVIYEDRFGMEEGASAEEQPGLLRTNIMQVAENGVLQVASVPFVEREIKERDLFLRDMKTDEELEEEKRLEALSTRIERNEAVVRPGNPVYLRLRDAGMSRTPGRDQVEVTVFTFGGAPSAAERRAEREIRLTFSEPAKIEASRKLPGNPPPPGKRPPASEYKDQPRLDATRVMLTETGPHSGIFYGRVETALSGPTAIASDQSGENAPILAMDGRNEAEHAWIGFIDGAPDKWLEIDLKRPLRIARVTWDRGAGADDRFMIDYSLSLKNDDGREVVLERKGNTSAHANEIELERPVIARYLRFTAHAYDGDAPAIAEIAVYDEEGTRIVPGEVSPLERMNDEILDFNIGDVMAAEYVDENNIDPGRPITRVSNAAGVGFSDGYIDAVHVSFRNNNVLGSRIITREEGGEDVWSRKTLRIGADDAFQFLIMDPDKDVSSRPDTVPCTISSVSGDSIHLVAREVLDSTGIFSAGIQLSSDAAARDDETRLFTRPGDILTMSYLDEHNRNPGHPVERYAHILVTPETAAEILSDSGARMASPRIGADGETSDWTFSVLSPDRAVPGNDRIELEALSFATGDHIRFPLFLRDLDGVFASVISARPGPRPASPSWPRQIRTRNEWWQRRQEEQTLLDEPFNVAGDDIVWLNHSDKTPRESADMLFVSILPPEKLQMLRDLGVDDRNLPAEARETGWDVELYDPHTRLRRLQNDQREEVLREIAHKKIQYRRLLRAYEDTLAGIGSKIEALREQAGALAEQTADTRDPEIPDPPDSLTAPLTEEEAPTEFADLGREQTLGMIELSRRRRDREALLKPMNALQRRLAALDARYDTAEREAAIGEREKSTGEGEAGPARADPVEKEEEPAWHTLPDWWRNTGALVPGTRLRIIVEDPDLRGDEIPVSLLPCGNGPVREISVAAKRVDEKSGRYEALVTTGWSAEDEAIVALEGIRYLAVSYPDESQTNFPAARSRFLSLASDAELAVTGPDFIEPRDFAHVGEDLPILVRDPDMDKTAERDFIWVELVADTGDRESIALREAQSFGGVFRGNAPTRLDADDAVPNDGVLNVRFGGELEVRYRDTLTMSGGEAARETIHAKKIGLVSGSDGLVEIFARQLQRGSLQRDVLFNTALAEYRLGQGATEIGAVERGRRYLLSGRERFQRLLEYYPDDPVCAQSTYYLGNIHFLLNDYPSAVRSLEMVMERWPKSEFHAKALFKLGTCHLKVGQREKALDSFVNLAYHYPDSPMVGDAMLILMSRFAEAENFPRAIGVGRAFLRKFPQHERLANVYLRVAGWLMAEEQYVAAIEILENAEEHIPGSVEMPAFLYWHADCIFRISRREEDIKRGIVMLDRVVYDYPDSRWARFAAARLAQIR